MKLRCVVIDDEYLARQRLLKLLAFHDNISVVAECRNGKEAIDAIKLKEPDFVFLDIQMPDLDGFSVLNKLNRMPYVIFTTAYDSFALKAFEINAVDYLLKPFDQDRLNDSLTRLIGLKKANKAYELGQKLGNLFQDLGQNEDSFYRHEFNIKKNGRLVRIRTDEISHIQSDGNYLELYTDNGKYLFRATMNAIESELDSKVFLRVHRSLILNKRYIKSCFYLGNSHYKISLKTGLDFTSGRSYKSNVVAFLEELEA